MKELLLRANNGKIALARVTKEGKGWRALCPFHPEKNPSLFIYPDGRFHCFGCNASGKVIEESSQLETSSSTLTVKDFSNAKNLPLDFLSDNYVRDSSKGVVFLYMPEDLNSAKAQKRYRYSIEGESRFGWERGSKPTLYGLWKLREFSSEEPLFITEGESDALTLWFCGFQALGVPGLNVWKKAWGEHLKGFKTIVVSVEPDSDGILFKNIVKTLSGVFVIPFNFEDTEFKDFSDAYLQLGVEKFKKFVISKIEETFQSVPHLKPISVIKQRAIEWVVPHWFPKGVITLVCGEPGIGKTTLLLTLCAAVASGSKVPTDKGFIDVSKNPVAYISLEDDLQTKIKSTLSLIDAAQSDNLYVAEASSFNELTRLIKENFPLIVIDPLSTIISQDINRADVAARMLRIFLNEAKKSDKAIVVTWHLNKSQDVLGSVIFKTIPKVVFLLVKDKETGKIVAENTKNAFSPLMKPLAFRIEEGVLNFCGLSEVGVDEIRDEAKKEKKLIEDFILNAIKDNGGSVLVSEMKKRAQLEGFNFSSVRVIAARLSSRGIIKKEILKNEEGKIKDAIWKSIVTNHSCYNGTNLAKSSISSFITKSENIHEKFLNTEIPLKFNDLHDRKKNNVCVGEIVTKEKIVENQAFSPLKQNLIVTKANDPLIYEATENGDKFARYSYFYDAPNFGDGDYDDEADIEGITVKGMIGDFFAEELIRTKYKDQIPEKAPLLDKFLSFLKYQAQKHQERLGILPPNEPFEMTWAFD